jgi:hypothetical protein
MRFYVGESSFSFIIIWFYFLLPLLSLRNFCLPAFRGLVVVVLKEPTEWDWSFYIPGDWLGGRGECFPFKTLSPYRVVFPLPPCFFTLFFTLVILFFSYFLSHSLAYFHDIWKKGIYIHSRNPEGGIV